MPRASRGLPAAAVALVVSVSLLVGAPSASGTRVLPHGDRTMPRFTHSHAKAVLTKAERQLKRDTARVRAHKPVGHGPSTDITGTLRDLFLARPSLTGAERQRADAILARPTDNGGDDLGGGEVVSYGSRTDNVHCFAVACIHWVTTDDHAGDGIDDAVAPTDANNNGIPDYVETVYATIAHVWSYETGTMGYKTPLGDGGTSSPHNPDSKLDIYLADLGPRGLYGYCSPDDSFSGRQVPAYCVLDNDYSTREFGTTPIKALEVTAAHEFFHAVQFAYDDDEDLWFMEGTATWMEDEVYDSINDNVQFLAYSPIRYPTEPTDLTTDYHRYGSWIFFRYASERLGRDIVRRMWQLADAGTSTRYSLQAIKAAVTARTPWAPFFATFAAWNTRQPHGYSEAARYPAPVWAGTRVLGKKHKSTGWLSIDLPHLSAAPLKLIPVGKPHRHLRIDANLPPTGRGSALLVQRRYKSGAVVNSIIRLDSRGDGHVRIGFNRKYLAYVAVIPANTSTAMVFCGLITGADGGPAYSCSGRGYYDYDQHYAVRAKVR